MTSLLFAVDGSPISLDAIHRALTLVPPPATVTLLHVSASPAAEAGAGGIEGPVYTPGELETLREAEAHDAEEVLDKAAGAVPSGYQVERRTDEGDPGTAICAAALAVDADLVVVGSHGRGALARMVLGSTSTYVVHHCRRPVMVVGHHDDGETEPAAG